MYDEFFQSEKMISVLEKIFSTIDFNSIDNNIFSELVLNKHSIKMDRIYKIIINNIIE